jgi:hypothetical protein
MAFTDGTRPEVLFDIQNDPGETKNLAYQADYSADLTHHRRLLQEWIAQTDDDFTAPWME